jgi:hypothetical protein
LNYKFVCWQEDDIEIPLLPSSFAATKPVESDLEESFASLKSDDLNGSDDEPKLLDSDDELLNNAIETQTNSLTYVVCVCS